MTIVNTYYSMSELQYLLVLAPEYRNCACNPSQIINLRVSDQHNLGFQKSQELSSYKFIIYMSCYLPAPFSLQEKQARALGLLVTS